MCSKQEYPSEMTEQQLLEWDPDYTKLTKEEARHLEAAEKSGFINDRDIDWSQVGQ